MISYSLRFVNIVHQTLWRLYMKSEIKREYLLFFNELDRLYAVELQQALIRELETRIKNSHLEQDNQDVKGVNIELVCFQQTYHSSIGQCNEKSENEDYKVMIFLNPRSTKTVAELCKYFSKGLQEKVIYIDRKKGPVSSACELNIHCLTDADAQFLANSIVILVNHW